MPVRRLYARKQNHPLLLEREHTVREPKNGDEAHQSENTALVFSCHTQNKHIEVRSYTWKFYPEKGVRYDIYVKDLDSGSNGPVTVNADMASVMGRVYELLREAMFVPKP